MDLTRLWQLEQSIFFFFGINWMIFQYFTTVLTLKNLEIAQKNEEMLRIPILPSTHFSTDLPEPVFWVPNPSLMTHFFLSMMLCNFTKKPFALIKNNNFKLKFREIAQPTHNIYILTHQTMAALQFHFLYFYF